MEALHSRARWRIYLTIGTFVALAILVYSLRKDIANVIDNLGKIDIVFLLLMIPLQFLNYDAYSRLFRSLFKILGKDVSYKSMFKFNLELNFVNHILPSGGVSGISYFNVRCKSLGISTATSTTAQVTKLLLLYTSFQPLLIIGLILLAVRGHTNNLILVVATALITLLVVGTFLAIYVAEDRHRINSTLTFLTRVLNRIIHLVRPKYPETINIPNAQMAFNELHDNYKIFKNNLKQLKWPFFYMTVANLTEVASVYVVYMAFGQFVNLGAVIIAYAVANFAGLISVLPAGIGIYEGLMTAILAACGIPAALSIPVTIMYRVVNMFIQLVPGYFFYQRAVRNGLSERP